MQYRHEFTIFKYIDEISQDRGTDRHDHFDDRGTDRHKYNEITFGEIYRYLVFTLHLLELSIIHDHSSA